MFCTISAEEKIGMNIKGVFGNIIAQPVKPVERLERAIKSDGTHDREGNGQQLFDQQQKNHEPMSEEQLEKSLEHLRNLPAVKENNWTIELSEVDGRRYIFVKDVSGNLIRKFPEADLWTLPVDIDDPKGQLLRKTA